MTHPLTKKNTYTLQCPKCSAIWRIKRYVDDEIFAEAMGMTTEDVDHYCPTGCRNIIGFKVKGKIQKKE